jgi:hypothetical protein
MRTQHRDLSAFGGLGIRRRPVGYALTRKTFFEIASILIFMTYPG